MSRPAITLLGASPAALMAAPAVSFRLRIDTGDRVHAIALRCQVQIEAPRRPYADEERERLYELFGDRPQFERLLRPLTWAQCSLVVPGFDRTIECDLQVPITYDLEVAAAKYLHGVRAGAIPLSFLFSGTMFRVSGGALQIEPVPWDVEAAFAMPADVWRAAMDRFFPGGGWLRVRQETLDRLQSFRGRAALVSWDEALGALLSRAEAERTA